MVQTRDKQFSIVIAAFVLNVLYAISSSAQNDTASLQAQIDANARATITIPAGDSGETPRHRYAVYVGSWHGQPEDSPNIPKGLTFAGNRFHVGTMGVANVSMDEFTNE